MTRTLPRRWRQAVAAGLLPAMQPSNEMPLLFPKGHNVQRFIEYSQDVRARLGKQP